jgi:hypothetical protein
MTPTTPFGHACMASHLFMAGNVAQDHDQAQGPAFLLPADEPGIPSVHPLDMFRKVLACS